MVPREGNAPSIYPYQGYVILFNYPGIKFFGELYEDRTHTSGITTRGADHYTNNSTKNSMVEAVGVEPTQRTV